MKKQVIWILCSTLSVLFHFDCVTSRVSDIVEVSLTLRSSPVPGEKSLTPVSSSLYLRQENVLHRKRARYKRQSISDGIKGILVITTDSPVSKSQKPAMSINVTTVGSTVDIKFGPVQLNISYRVCLSTFAKDYDCYKDTKTQQGQDFAVFKNVQPNSYRIYVQNDLNDPIYASKPFNVTESWPTSTEPPPTITIVATITMACVLFIAGVTTLSFCLMKRCQCWKIGSCGLYQRTPQSVPNNIHEEEEDGPMIEVLPMYYDESENFKSAVQKVCLYLSKWANCKVNYDWMSSFSDDQTLSFKKKHPNCILLIFLSSKMWLLLNNGYQGDDWKTRLFKRILQECEGKAFPKMIVSLHPLSAMEHHLNSIKVFRITKHVLGSNPNRLEINTEDLYIMLEEINGEMGEVKNGWSSYEEMLILHDAIKYVPYSDLHISELPVRLKDTYYINRETIDMPTEWARSQQIGRFNPYSQSGYNPLPHCYLEDEQLDQSNQLEDDPDIESASMCQENIYQSVMIQPANHRGYPENHLANHTMSNQHGGWIPPEDDSESVSHSVIDQQQMEIYQNYRVNIGDTRV